MSGRLPDGVSGGAGRLSASVITTLILFYSLFLFDHDLWTPDEPRVASIAKSVTEGSWIVPLLGDRPFLEQPPLYVWLVGLVYKMFGFDPLTLARTVSAALAAGTLLWTYLLGRGLAQISQPTSAWTPHRVGLLAALCLGLTFGFFVMSHRVVVDGALVFFTTGAAYALFRGLPILKEKSHWGWLLAGYSMASLAFLGKGVLGIAFPALAYFALVIALRRPRLLLQGKLWLAPLAFAALVGPWLALLYREAGEEALREVLLVNTFGRALPVSFALKEHVHPVYYYLFRTPFGFLPTTIFALGAVAYCFRLRDSSESSGCKTAFWWFLLGMLLLSAASTKRAIYALPLFPALAVAAGFWLEEYLVFRVPGRYPRLVSFAMVLTLPVCGVAVLAAAFVLEGALLPWAIPAPLVAAAITYRAASAVKADSRGRLLECWLTGLIAIGLCAKLALVPAFERDLGLGGITQKIAAQVPANETIHVFKADETTIALYPLYASRLARELSSAAELEALLDEFSREGRDLYLVTTDKRTTTELPKHPSTSRRIQFPKVKHLGPEILLEDFVPKGRKSRLLLFRAKTEEKKE